MRHVRLGTLAAATAAVLALPLAGCGGDDDNGAPPRPQTAALRVVHASPDAPPVDVLVNGTTVLRDVPFRAFSGYLPVPGGRANVQVRVAGTTTTVIDVAPDLAGGRSYTALAVNRVASIAPLLLEDDRTAPGPAAVKVRVVHGAPGAPEVDVYVTAPGADLATATPVLTNVPYRGVSGYLSVPPGAYQVRVTVAGTKTVAIDSGPLQLAGNTVRTAVAVDAPGGGAPFGLVLLPDVN